MKRYVFVLWSIFICFLGLKSQVLPSKSEVIGTMENVNNYWINTHPDPGNNLWDRATYFSGNMAFYDVYSDEQYYDYANLWANNNNWDLNNGSYTRHADDQCVGQTYIRLYELDPEPQSYKIADITTSVSNMVNSSQSDDWWWVDAFHMAMPVFTKLGLLYGDENYFDKMYDLYAYAKYNRGLYNSGWGLWYRDGDYINYYPNNLPCFWSRGNGWVFAAHAKVLEYLPLTDSHRDEYIQTFQAMANTLKNYQREDGFWNVNLVNPYDYVGPETSGTAFFTYGIAWGISKGILDSATYMPIVEKAWNGLITIAVHPDGYLGYVQGVGKEPSSSQPVTYESTADFGVGAFLMAGSEVVKLASGTMPSPPGTVHIDNVTASTQNTVEVVFSEVVTQATAENISNYTINNGVQVINAVLNADNKTVQLTTSDLSTSSYTLEVNNVESIDGDIIEAGSQVNFTFYINCSTTVTAIGYQDPNVPENTLDGNLNTRWSQEDSAQWIKYDLCQEKTIQSVSIAFYNGDQRISYFDIEVSNDDIEYTQVFSGQSNGQTTNLEIFDFADVDARYVRIIGNGNSVNLWNSYNEVVINTHVDDFEAPSVPGNLSYSNVTTTSVQLTWSLSTDNVGVAGYKVYTNGSNPISVAGTSKSVTGLIEDTSYDFSVTAYDAAGNESSQSNVVQVVTSSSGTPGENLILNSEFDEGISNWTAGNFAGDANISVVTGESMSGDNALEIDINSAGYNPWDIQIYQPMGMGIEAGKTYQISFMAKAESNRNMFSVIQQVEAPYTEYWLEEVQLTTTTQNFGPYTFISSTTNNNVWFKFFVGANYSTIYIDNVVITEISSGGTDTQAPSVPGTPVASNITTSSVNLSWNISTDNVAVTGYNVYRNGAFLKAVTSNSTSVTGLTPSTSYTFRVSAFDAEDNESAQSGQVDVTTQSVLDNQAPTVPTGVTVINVTSNSVTLNWNPSSDNVGVAGYKIYNRFTYLQTVSTATALVTGLSPNTTYFFRISAFDAAGNESGRSPSRVVTTLDNTDVQSPSVPGVPVASSITSTGVILNWSASTDNVGVNGYNIYRNGSYLTTVGSTTSVITGLTSSTSYVFRVSAFDAAGNESAQSGSVNVTTLEQTGITSNSSWQNFAFETQTGTFTVEYDAVPHNYNMDGVVGILNGVADAFPDLACIVRFNTYGQIDARNGGSYDSDASVYYSLGTTYHFRLEINIFTHSYSVYVTPAGQLQVTVANNYSFRSEQSGVTSLDAWVITAVSGSHTVSNFTVNSSSAGEINFADELNPSISVYPNPITGKQLFIKLNGYNTEIINVKLYDALGKIAYSVEKNMGKEIQLTIPVEELEKGVYILTIAIDNSDIKQERIIIQ